MNSNVSFETINGKIVFQIFTEPNISNKNLVIMSHGFNCYEKKLSEITNQTLLPRDNLGNRQVVSPL